jgi:hypothetical protein
MSEQRSDSVSLRLARMFKLFSPGDFTCDFTIESFTFARPRTYQATRVIILERMRTLRLDETESHTVGAVVVWPRWRPHPSHS